MRSRETAKNGGQVTAYLRCMQTLQSEMTVAMGHVAASRLSPLQESIEKQEALCAELALVASILTKTLAKTQGNQGGRLTPLSLAGGDAALAGELQAAGSALRQTNLAYGAVLQHSGKTLSLLTSLCNTHTGAAQGARGSRSRYQTWSCEV